MSDTCQSPDVSSPDLSSSPVPAVSRVRLFDDIVTLFSAFGLFNFINHGRAEGCDCLIGALPLYSSTYMAIY